MARLPMPIQTICKSQRRKLRPCAMDHVYSACGGAIPDISCFSVFGGVFLTFLSFSHVFRFSFVFGAHNKTIPSRTLGYGTSLGDVSSNPEWAIEAALNC